MAIASLWAQLGLDIAGFKAGLAQSASLSQQFGKKVAGDMRNAFFGAMSPKRWFSEVSAAAAGAASQLASATQDAAGMPAAMDIPLDDLTRLETVSQQINASLEDMVALWKSNTSVAKEFRDTIKTLRPIGPSGTWGDVGRGWQGAKTLGGDLFSRLLGLSTWGNVSLNAIRAFGAGIRAREDAAKRAMGIAGSPKLGPGNEEGEQDWMLLNYQRWIDMMRGPVFGPGNAAGFQELIGIREQRRTNAFSLGRPDQGSLSGIGGFTSAAGILARTEAKTQTEFLKLIEEHTKETAALHRMQAAEAVLE